MCNESGKVKALMVYADADEMSSAISKICGGESEWTYSPSRSIIHNKDETWLVHVVRAENIPVISGRTYDVVMQSGRAVVTNEHAELIATRLTNKGSNMSFDVLDELVGIRDFVFFSSIMDWK